MTNETPKRLSDLRGAGSGILIDGFAGQEITIRSVEFLKSQFDDGDGTESEYVLMVADTANGDGVRIRSGAKPVVKTMHEIAESLPLIVRVKKLGRTFILE